MKKYELIVDDFFLNTLKKFNIFQKRYSPNLAREELYQNRLHINDKILFERYTVIEEYSTFANGNILFSAGSFSSLVSCLPIGSVTGRYTCLAGNFRPMGFRHPIESVCLSSAVFHFSREYLQSYFYNYEQDNGRIEKKPVPTPQPQDRPIEIGHDVWIGANVSISGGVKIGNGAVIASNSIVTKNVEAYSIVAGSPAKHKKYRFDEKIRCELEIIQWWNYELGDIYKKELNFANPEEFINKFKLLKSELNLLNVKKFKPYVYKFYGVTDKEIIFDEHNKYFCYDIRENKIFLKEKKADMSNFQDNIISLKNINGQEFLYLESYGFINISDQLEFNITKSENEIKYIIIRHSEGFSVKINNKYLCADKLGYLRFAKHMKEWEIFHSL